VGILNGIDEDIWDPATDTYITDQYSVDDADVGKAANKKVLCDQFGLDEKKPLIIFIGRLVGEKAADLLPRAIADSINYINGEMNFLILGSGESDVENQLQQMNGRFVGYYNSQIGYNEKLAHQMYAGADFLLLPSRVEPCGLNQMYAMRYGTIPIVRNTGGLRDTVKDFGEEGGYGICFNQASVGDITNSVYRAIQLYSKKKEMGNIRKQMMQIDNSWENSAGKYISIYQTI
ncbi:MAG: glycosyltransferase, partial [Ginsengibacter sp.]